MSSAADSETTAAEGAAPAPSSSPASRRRHRAKSLFVACYDRADRVVTRWALRGRFGKWLGAKLWMPLYAKTRLEALGEQDGAFYARLPFRRPNRNWYGDIAGSALLAATELAAGEPLFARYGQDYVVVCSHLGYDFLRPLRGAAILRSTPQEELPEATPPRPFRVTFDLVVFEEDRKTKQRRKAGRGVITFRLVPKSALQERARPLLPL